MKNDCPDWASLIYVPGDDAQALADACAGSAHAIIIDLEDFVPHARKDAARARIGAAVAAIRRAGRGVVVRVNRRLDTLAQDLSAAVIEGVDALMITKADSAEYVRLIDTHVTLMELERQLPARRIRFIPMIETAGAIPRTEAIASASTRIMAINVGAEDLAAEMSVPTDSPLLVRIKERMIVAAFAAGVLPYGHLASVKAFGSDAGYRAMLTHSYTLGFRGATCLNARQAEAINAIYRAAMETAQP
jgi:citrate lyase subunit beta/citryl-CoA lyase